MKLLTICIPTYNRADIVVEDVETYLSVKDERFSVKVCDNGSSDDTISRLTKIDDDRLIIVQNKENIGGIPNMVKALANNDSVFSLLVLDKDILDTNLLSSFLDKLNDYTDCGLGFINPEYRLSHNVNKQCVITQCGIDNVIKMAYLNQHPSGYLYKSKVFDEAIESGRIKQIENTFVFIFEVINSDLAYNHKSVVFEWPMVIRARERGYDGKSITYSESNLWYSGDYRLNTYKVYLKDVFKMQASKSEKKKISFKVTNNALRDVSTVLKTLMMNDYASDHYGVKKRKVTFYEMLQNSGDLCRIYKSICTPAFSITYITFSILVLYVINLLRIIISYVRQ